MDEHHHHRSADRRDGTDRTLTAVENPNGLCCESCRKLAYAKADPLTNRISWKRSTIRRAKARLEDLQALVERAKDHRDFAAQACLPNNNRLLAETQAAIAKHEAELGAMLAARDARKAAV